MHSLPDLIRQSAGHPWLFILSAILLGGLHGLEPGHSKTMMAAFIIAIRGTVMQAVLLGLSAMVSHTAVVWVVALGGQYLYRGLDTAVIEPYFQLASAALITGIAVWMMWRTRRGQVLERSANAGHEVHHHHHVHQEEVPRHDLVLAEGHHHAAAHSLGALQGEGHRDAHALAHAEQINRRFRGGNVTTWQIIAFGLTGGLVPCPAAITMLLLCLQLKRIALGVVLVGFFSIGLAITMVMAGVIASLSIHHVRRRWPGFDGLATRAPYASGVLMLLIALYMGVSGWLSLT